MTTVCVIGDSHCSQLMRQATLNLIPAGFDLVFFTSHITLIQELTLSGRSLVAGSELLRDQLKIFSHGQDHIDIDRYDRFVIVGLDLGVGPTVKTYEHYMTDAMPGPADGRYLLSDQCFVSLAETVTMRCAALRLALLIRSVCAKPITLVSTPNPGLGLAEAEFPQWFPPCHLAVRNGDDQALAAVFRDVCRRIGHKHRLDIIPPLQEAAANGLFNHQEYSELTADLAASPPLQRLNAVLHASPSYANHLLPYLFADTGNTAQPLAAQ